MRWYGFLVFYVGYKGGREIKAMTKAFERRDEERKAMTTEKIGFVGVGRMGANMARRLKECGYEIAAVYDVNAAAAQSLAQELGCPAAGQLKAGHQTL